MVILGGAGFIGSHLAESLLDRGHQVRVFDLPDCSFNNIAHIEKNIKIVRGDFNNEKNILSAVRGTEIVFHLISTTVPANSNENPVFDIETNVVNTIKMLDICVKEKVKKVVFLSSGGTVYGVCKDLPINESASLQPISSYGISKMVIENYLFLYHYLYGLDYTVIRAANAYGERQSPFKGQGVIGVWLNRILNNEPIEFIGDGSVVRDYIYVKDLTDALCIAAMKSTKEKIFNAGSGKGYSLAEILEIIKNLATRKTEIIYKKSRKLDVPVNVLDISLIEKCLGWSPETDISKGIKETWKWLTEQNRKATKLVEK